MSLFLCPRWRNKIDWLIDWLCTILQKGKVFYSQEPTQWRIYYHFPVENLYYHCSWSQLSTTFSNAAWLVQWAAPSCSRPQPTTDNGVRVGRSNWLTVTPHPLQGGTARYKNQECCQGIWSLDIWNTTSTSLIINWTLHTLKLLSYRKYILIIYIVMCTYE